MNRARRLALAVLGTAMELIRPGLAREVDEGIHSGRSVRAKNWILRARLERARLAQDDSRIRQAQAGFWKGETGDFFYDRYRDRFETLFLGPHHVVVDELARLHALHGFQRLIEVGCGDGRVLAHCASRLPGLGEAIGIDINPTIIAEDRRVHGQNPRLRFEAGDAGDLLPGLVGPGTVLMTYGGVMEYLSGSDLRSVYRMLGERAESRPGGAVAVALVEPLAPDHDLDRHPGSVVFGREHSFSHNYPHLLGEAGFKPVYRRELQHEGVRWLMLVAVKGGPGKGGANGA